MYIHRKLRPASSRCLSCLGVRLCVRGGAGQVGLLLLLPAREISVIDHSCIIKLRARFHYVASCRKKHPPPTTQSSCSATSPSSSCSSATSSSMTVRLTNRLPVSAYVYSTSPHCEGSLLNTEPQTMLRWWCGQYKQWWYW